MENSLEPKRRKISVACDLCRLRKSRCDGRKPVCGKCLRRKRTSACFYREESLSSRPHGRPPLEQSLRDVELRGASASISESPYDTSPLNTVFDFVPQTENTIPTEALPSKPVSKIAAGSADLVPQNCPIGTESNTDNEAVDTGILGPSSAASFATTILRMAKCDEQLARVRVISTNQNIVSLRLGGKRKRHSIRGPQYVLPPRKVADRLMSIHWDYGHTMYPWLDRLQFEKQYAHLWSDIDDGSSLTMDEQVFYCILNIIFALAYKQDPSLSHQEQDESAESHFDRAQVLLSINILEMAHLELVQALLMMAQYLQSIQKPSQCFSCVGLAIWVAQEIGLNSPGLVSSINDPHEQDIAKRIWQGCILMDRISAMMLGRTPRISKDVASLALPPSTREEIPYGVGIPSTLDYLMASCSLYEILGNVLSTFYRQIPPRNQTGFSSGPSGVNITSALSLEITLQLEDSLAEWNNGLPSHLQLESGFDDPTRPKIFFRQSLILRARYLHLRMLLFRPFFLQASSRPTSQGNGILLSRNRSPFSQSITAQCLRASTETAQNVIDHIVTCAAVDRSMKLQLPWWQLSSYVYHACTVVIAAHLLLKLVEPITLDLLTASYERGIQVLQQLENDRSHVQKFRHALQALYGAVAVPSLRGRSSSLLNEALRPTELQDLTAESLEGLELNPELAGLLSIEEAFGIEELFGGFESITWT